MHVLRRRGYAVALLSASVLGLVLLLGTLWGSRPLIHDDLFYHIRTGEIVMSEGRVPTTDPFSFTRYGERWVTHEWGFGVVVYLAERLGGLEGLVALKVATVIAILLSLGWLAYRAQPDAAFLIPPALGLGLIAAFYQLILRAALFSSLFLIWELLLLEAYRRTGRRSFLWVLVLLLFVWSNVHSGVVFGFLLLGCWVVEALVGSFFAGREGAIEGMVRVRDARALILTLLVSVLASLANPNGIDTLLYPFHLSMFLFAGELDLQLGHFTSASPANSPAFYLLVVALLAGLVPAKQIRRLSLSEILSVAAFLILSIRSHRFIFEFVVVAVPVLLRLHERVVRLRFAWVLPAATAAVLVWMIVPAYRNLEPGALSEHFPERAAAFLEREGVQGRIVNHQNYGGYLSWRLRMPIFWNGDNLLFGSLIEELQDMTFRELTERWQPDIVIVQEQEYTPIAETLSGPDWGLVYWDDYCAVFLRRIPRFEKVLDRYEYRFFPPFGPVPELQRAVADPETLRRARIELDRAVSQNPRTQRALYYHGLLSSYGGDYRRARDELERAGAIRPNPYVDRALLDVYARFARSLSGDGAAPRSSQGE